MADEDKEEGKGGEEGEAKPKGKRKLIIIVAAVLVVVVLVVVGVLAMGGKKKTPAEEAEAAMNEKEEVHLGRAELEQFIVNLATSNSYLRTKILLEFDEEVLAAASKKSDEAAAHGGGEGGGKHGEGGSDSKGLPGLLGERTPMIRDAIITVLGNKKADELLSTSGKERVKEELVDAINEAVGAEEPVVLKIYFVDFIIQ